MLHEIHICNITDNDAGNAGHDHRDADRESDGAESMRACGYTRDRHVIADMMRDSRMPTASHTDLVQPVMVLVRICISHIIFSELTEQAMC